MIERGGTPQQRVLRGSLASVAIEAPEWADGGPALLLLGEAVAMTAGERALLGRGVTDCAV
jgi:uroporphyrin-III C-methyltransferase/precorrin-2 dehydrogenase/sirohydrochlorin ferrochelatase